MCEPARESAHEGGKVVKVMDTGPDHIWPDKKKKIEMVQAHSSVNC